MGNGLKNINGNSMQIDRIVTGTLASYLNTAVSMIGNLILVPMYLFYFSKDKL